MPLFVTLRIDRRTWRALERCAARWDSRANTLACDAIRALLAAERATRAGGRVPRDAARRHASAPALDPPAAAPLEVVWNGAIGKAGASLSSYQRKIS